MINLQYVEDELNFAKQELDVCIQTRQERHWRHFVEHLEVLLTNLMEITKGTSLEKDVKAALELKKKDPLLKYVRESRNTISHTAKRLTDKEPGKKIEGSDFKPIGAFIKAVDGTVIPMTNGFLFEVDFVLKTVKDKPGNIVVLPNYHLGQPIKNPSSPAEVGKKALDFYTQLVQNIKVQNV